jgi:hypothetical protein
VPLALAAAGGWTPALASEDAPIPVGPVGPVGVSGAHHGGEVPRPPGTGRLAPVVTTGAST